MKTYSHVAHLNPFRYRGYMYDEETGLYLTGTRYYDPEIGRFINADRYVSTGQGILGNNMFAYCGNNPVNRVDPTGQFWITALVVTAVVTVCTFTLSGCSSNNKKAPDPEPYSNQANCYAYAMKLENDPIAKAVKLADLRHNSDLSRLDVIDQNALARKEKYQKAIALLEA